jgi:hypothetical protein
MILAGKQTMQHESFQVGYGLNTCSIGIFNIYFGSTWHCFSEEMAGPVEAAYQERGAKPKIILNLIHPLRQKSTPYEYDFSTDPMTQKNTVSGFCCSIRRQNLQGCHFLTSTNHVFASTNHFF